MNVVAEIERINERELALGVPFEASWHQKYASSAWVFVGGLPFELSEGDVLCVLSQFGEIEDVHLVRDTTTGRSRGFAFLKFEDQRSTVLAVDNLNGARVLERVLRVDHVLQYKLPKEVRERHENADESDDGDEKEKAGGPRGLPGHAYEGRELENNGFDLTRGHDVFAAPPESKRERKKRRKEDKKREKHAKKARKLEEKQFALAAEIQQRRQLERERAEREQRAGGGGGDEEEERNTALEPSASGWRGRFEPNAAPVRGQKHREKPSDSRVQRNDEADVSYGGARRTR